MIPAPWRARRANYATEELVGRSCARPAQSSASVRGALRRSATCRGGRAAESAEHRSHQNGRDVDVFFYGVDREGRPCRPAMRCSTSRPMDVPSAGRRRKACAARGPVPAVRFDARRNWAFVRALLSDPEAEVQWIFIAPRPGGGAAARGDAAGDDPALVARASFIIQAAERLGAHDDHMHVRLYCAADRRLGCVDKGPVRWWKKMWKYMGAPMGVRRPTTRRGRTASRQFGRLFRGELPAHASSPAEAPRASRSAAAPSRQRSGVAASLSGFVSGRTGALQRVGARAPSRRGRSRRRD